MLCVHANQESIGPVPGWSSMSHEDHPETATGADPLGCCLDAEEDLFACGLFVEQHANERHPVGRP
ncbi:MAG: hypothetical protein ACK559_36895, partial [bacterium]